MAYEWKDVQLPVDPRLIQTLGEEWQRFGQPGTWWRGEERLAIAAEARMAHDCRRCAQRNAMLSPEGREHRGNGILSATAVDAAHRIATDPGRLSSRWYAGVVAGGVSPEQLVEMTGVIAILTIGDTLSRACGVAASPLPEPVAGRPSRVRPPGLETESAWVPVVHEDLAQGPIRESYEQMRRVAGFVYNIGRALTLVPEEALGFGRAFFPIYNTYEVPPPDALTRPQMELLAASVSAVNDCFY